MKLVTAAAIALLILSMAGIVSPRGSGWQQIGAACLFVFAIACSGWMVVVAIKDIAASANDFLHPEERDQETPGSKPN